MRVTIRWASLAGSASHYAAFARASKIPAGRHDRPAPRVQEPLPAGSPPVEAIRLTPRARMPFGGRPAAASPAGPASPGHSAKNFPKISDKKTFFYATWRGAGRVLTLARGDTRPVHAVRAVAIVYSGRRPSGDPTVARNLCWADYGQPPR